MISEVTELSKSLEKHLFANWELQVVTKKNLEKEIRAFLLRIKARLNLNLQDIDELSYKILESLKKYGKRN